MMLVPVFSIIVITQCTVVLVCAICFRQCRDVYMCSGPSLVQNVTLDESRNMLWMTSLHLASLKAQIRAGQRAIQLEEVRSPSSDCMSSGELAKADRLCALLSALCGASPALSHSTRVGGVAPSRRTNAEVLATARGRQLIAYG